jgi:hypothetical protein
LHALAGSLCKQTTPLPHSTYSATRQQGLTAWNNNKSKAPASAAQHQVAGVLYCIPMKAVHRAVDPRLVNLSQHPPPDAHGSLGHTATLPPWFHATTPQQAPEACLQKEPHSLHRCAQVTHVRTHITCVAACAGRMLVAAATPSSHTPGWCHILLLSHSTSPQELGAHSPRAHPTLPAQNLESDTRICRVSPGSGKVTTVSLLLISHTTGDPTHPQPLRHTGRASSSLAEQLVGCRLPQRASPA